MPSEGRAFPAVLVVQEIFGVHEHIKDVCRRLAKSGYLAVAPELYARQGDVSRLSEIDEIRKIVANVPDAQVMTDLDATVEWIKASGNGNVKKLGVTGFCWGGRMVWLYAAHSVQVKAGVAWYGRLVGKATDLQPAHPLDMAANLKVPVLGLYGGSDQGIPLETVEQMKQALRAADSASTIIVYPDTPHAFYADYRASYRKEAAEDGWSRLLAWFKGTWGCLIPLPTSPPPPYNAVQTCAARWSPPAVSPSRPRVDAELGVALLLRRPPEFHLTKRLGFIHLRKGYRHDPYPGTR